MDQPAMHSRAWRRLIDPERQDQLTDAVRAIEAFHINLDDLPSTFDLLLDVVLLSYNMELPTPTWTRLIQTFQGFKKTVEPPESLDELVRMPHAEQALAILTKCRFTLQWYGHLPRDAQGLIESWTLAHNQLTGEERPDSTG